MKFFTCIVTFIVTYLAVVLAANERQILVRVRPVTRKQYESIMNINNGNADGPEGRIIGSAITGLTGFASGLKISNFLPNIFGSNNQNTKGSTASDNYPLCTFDTNSLNGRQNDAASYLNIDQIANSLVQSSESTNNVPIVNCILVLDDSKDKPIDEPLLPDSPDDLEDIEEPEQPKGRPTKPPTYPYRPIYQPPLHPPTSQMPYPPFYYPYYPYSPPAYPQQPFYPMPHPPYDKYPIYEKDEETNNDEVTTPSPDSTLDLQALIMNKLQAIHSLTTTTSTTRKPTKRLRRRPALRNHSQSSGRSIHKTSHSKSQKKKLTDKLNKYDDSLDYTEAARHF